MTMDIRGKGCEVCGRALRKLKTIMFEHPGLREDDPWERVEIDCCSRCHEKTAQVIRALDRANVRIIMGNGPPPGQQTLIDL